MLSSGAGAAGASEPQPPAPAGGGGPLSHMGAFFASIVRPEPEEAEVVEAAAYARAGPLAGLAAATDNYFKISHRKSTFYYEVVGGLTTFFAMCYILALNGVILAGTGISKNGSFFATALAGGIFTTLMGLFVNVPVALSPGMGLNGYFASLVVSGKMTYQDALGAVFLSGIFYLVFTVTGLRAMVRPVETNSITATPAPPLP